MELFNIKYFDLCYEPLPFPVEVFDEKGFVVYVNTEFTKRWGYSLVELSGYSYATDKELQKGKLFKKSAQLYRKRNLSSFKIMLIQDCSVPIEQCLF